MFGGRRGGDGAPQTEEGTTSGRGNETTKAQGARSHRIVVPLLAVLLVAVAGLTGLAYHEFSGATVEATRRLEYADALHEDLSDLVRCSSDFVECELAGDVDITSVGVQELPVRLTMGPLSRTEVVGVEVVDTQSPKIELAAKSVTIELGEAIDSSEIVREVTDPVDGSLSELEREPTPGQGEPGRADIYEKGFFVLEGTDGLEEAGTHDVCVRASDSHGNVSEEHVEVVVSDPLEGVVLKQETEVLEYSNKPIDPVKLVSCNLDGVGIKASKIDLTKVGKTTVAFTLTKGASSRTEELTFEVRDTKKPTVEVKADSFEIEKNQPFDRYSIVKSVQDPVDGELAKVGKEGDGEGSYSVEGTFDNANPGTYSLTVVAKDRNGNQTEKKVKLTVKEPKPEPEPEPEPQPVAQPVAQPTQAPQATPAPTKSAERHYVLNTNTERFHEPGCGDIKKMSDKNREEVLMSRDDIIAMGYSPCAHCNP